MAVDVPDLPEIPELPTPEIDESPLGEPLFDTSLGFREQTRRLKAYRDYEDGED